MHKVSAKRQVTLPKELCDKTGITPGDYVEIFEYLGKITVIKKVIGSSKGSLSYLKARSDMTDQESMADAINDRH
ncbi:AbrB/MazE/SpoVT family DNA-binding domain-containing protein [Leucothrix pacifica]|uniref:AbrB family transcriptional regulator n=1 Tax=Leucothrix pacifica TaxID=1247513 RepID=A0A317C9L9_9GAMM|nr:AbrB/MazE/SpoVT family DNA-binding domain-containing protein [Leucothrix pacifica]PWQ95069.1 AbrB family transcriptional regulator [Leucothrix pacifica]